MSLQLFGHPFSSYTRKPLIALYENQTPFKFRMLGPDHPDNGAELARRWPVAKFPLLVDGETTVFETSAIIGMLNHVFDNYVMGPMQAIVGDAPRRCARSLYRRAGPHHARYDLRLA
jgi:glutathione S-transferase